MEVFSTTEMIKVRVPCDTINTNNFNRMKQIIILFLLVFSLACNTQKKFQKSYIGQPLTELEKELGKPTTVFEKNNGNMYVFEKKEKLKSAEISQHKLTLDPMVSPEALKTSRYYVTVVDGVITKIKIEEEYERRN